MDIYKIVAAVNAKLAGETLTLNQMRIFIDETIDDINTELNACFPTTDGLTESDTYDAIPDKYIRSCIVSGAAYKFYETDEEGAMSAQQYHYNYLDRLYYMKRDYSCSIPEEYRQESGGWVYGPAPMSGLKMQVNTRGW